MPSLSSPFGWVRRRTRVVPVGDVAVGGDNPIRVQSMTTPQTADVTATVEQIVRLARAGCEIVRVTVPTSRDAAALPEIRGRLVREGIRVPLVADIHFSPAAAMLAVEHVEKVRINPGNYADKKRFQVFEIAEADYAAELDRIEQVVRPLILRAKQLGRAMRIGTNHGSLSDRIMNRYGDTPLGMVESALEFVRICEAHGFRDIILSMKSSNPQVMIQAYRLLASRMAAEGMDYPFHIGVTEAGDGEDGRIKSAVGIGALLEEGIGDTVRVSLTEDPVEEIPVARRLVEKFDRWILGLAPTPQPIEPARPVAEVRDPFVRSRRIAREAAFGPVVIGGDRRVSVEVFLGPFLDGSKRCEREERLEKIKAAILLAAGAQVPDPERAEFLELAVRDAEDVRFAAALREFMEAEAPDSALSARAEVCALFERPDLAASLAGAAHRITLKLGALAPAPRDLPETIAHFAESAAAAGSGLLLVGRGGDAEAIGRVGFDSHVDLLIATLQAARTAGLSNLAAAMDASTLPSPIGAVRLMAARLAAAGCDVPIVLLEDAAARGEDPLLGSSSVAGSLLCDGIGDSIQIAASTPADSRRLALGILQATRARISRTDFISCPSCGRTQFDLETTTRRIKEKTGHLKGLKIAIMGCIVNGPGEMADADFGYVGWGRDRISLFVGKDLVAKDIPTEEADRRLIELIKEHGRWVDPAS